MLSPIVNSISSCRLISLVYGKTIRPRQSVWLIVGILCIWQLGVSQAQKDVEGFGDSKKDDNNAALQNTQKGSELGEAPARVQTPIAIRPGNIRPTLHATATGTGGGTDQNGPPVPAPAPAPNPTLNLRPVRPAVAGAETGGNPGPEDNPSPKVALGFRQHAQPPSAKRTSPQQEQGQQEQDRTQNRPTQQEQEEQQQPQQQQPAPQQFQQHQQIPIHPQFQRPVQSASANKKKTGNSVTGVGDDGSAGNATVGTTSDSGDGSGTPASPVGNGEHLAGITGDHTAGNTGLISEHSATNPGQFAIGPIGERPSANGGLRKKPKGRVNAAPPGAPADENGSGSPTINGSSGAGSTGGVGDSTDSLRRHPGGLLASSGVEVADLHPGPPGVTPGSQLVSPTVVKGKNPNDGNLRPPSANPPRPGAHRLQEPTDATAIPAQAPGNVGQVAEGGIDESESSALIKSVNDEYADVVKNLTEAGVLTEADYESKPVSDLFALLLEKLINNNPAANEEEQHRLVHQAGIEFVEVFKANAAVTKNVSEIVRLVNEQLQSAPIILNEGHPSEAVGIAETVTVPSGPLEAPATPALRFGSPARGRVQSPQLNPEPASIANGSNQTETQSGGTIGGIAASNETEGSAGAQAPSVIVFGANPKQGGANGTGENRATGPTQAEGENEQWSTIQPTGSDSGSQRNGVGLVPSRIGSNGRPGLRAGGIHAVDTQANGPQNGAATGATPTDIETGGSPGNESTSTSTSSNLPTLTGVNAPGSPPDTSGQNNSVPAVEPAAATTPEHQEVPPVGNPRFPFPAHAPATLRPPLRFFTTSTISTTKTTAEISNEPGQPQVGGGGLLAVNAQSPGGAVGPDGSQPPVLIAGSSPGVVPIGRADGRGQVGRTPIGTGTHPEGRTQIGNGNPSDGRTDTGNNVPSDGAVPIGLGAPDGKPQIGTDGRTPTGADGRTPTETDGRTPTETDGRTPVGTDGRTPVGTDGRTPVGTDGRTPIGRTPTHVDSSGSSIAGVDFPTPPAWTFPEETNQSPNGPETSEIAKLVTVLPLEPAAGSNSTQISITAASTSIDHDPFEQTASTKSAQPTTSPGDILQPFTHDGGASVTGQISNFTSAEITSNGTSASNGSSGEEWLEFGKGFSNTHHTEISSGESSTVVSTFPPAFITESASASPVAPLGHSVPVPGDVSSTNTTNGQGSGLEQNPSPELEHTINANHSESGLVPGNVESNAATHSAIEFTSGTIFGESNETSPVSSNVSTIGEISTVSIEPGSSSTGNVELSTAGHGIVEVAGEAINETTTFVSTLPGVPSVSEVALTEEVQVGSGELGNTTEHSTIGSEINLPTVSHMENMTHAGEMEESSVANELTTTAVGSNPIFVWNFKLSDTTWDPEFLNKESETFQRLHNELTSDLQTLFKTLEPKHFVDVTIKRFSKGSVIVDGQTEMNERVDTIQLLESFVKLVAEHKNTIGGHVVDTTSISFDHRQYAPQAGTGTAASSAGTPNWVIALIVAIVLLALVAVAAVVLIKRKKRQGSRDTYMVDEETMNGGKTWTPAGQANVQQHSNRGNGLVNGREQYSGVNMYEMKEPAAPTAHVNYGYQTDRASNGRAAHGRSVTEIHVSAETNVDNEENSKH